MNSEEKMVIIVAALNLIKRKQDKKYKNSPKKTSVWTKPWLLRRFIGVTAPISTLFTVISFLPILHCNMS